MPRDTSLTRQEAELLTELLMLTDEWPSLEIDEQLREQWGMSSRAEELKTRGKSLTEVRQEWAQRLSAK